MNVLISIAVWTAGILMTVAVYIAMLLCVVIFPFDKQRKIAHSQCYWWSDILSGMNPFWSIRVNGLKHIDKNKAYVIVVNHQSLADIIILYQIKSQFKWVAKESLFKVPVLGWCLSVAKHVRLTRGDFSSIKKVYRQAAEWLRGGISVLFFPEGTRGTSDDMSDFLNGAFKLAIKEKKDMLPIVISGARDAIPKGSWIFKSKVECVVDVLEPVDISPFAPGDFEKLKELVRGRMVAAAK